MRPLKLRKEIDGFLADRLLEAVWRESLWLVHDDVATVEEIDDALRFGAGPRWALMGSFLTYRIAGGEEGMRHFMAQFGPALKWPWTKLMDVPELTDSFLDKLAEQSDEQAAGQSIRELERRRDDGLIAILQGLRTQDWGAGSVLKAHEERLYSRFHAQAAKAEPDLSQPFSLHQGTVPPEWLDYNGHMNESRYLQVFGDATDAVLGFIGLNADYLASGRSIYTVETHIRHLAETRVSTAFHVTTQVLGQDEKRIHLWHEMFRSEDHTLLATGEHMLLHVDTHAGRSCPMEPELLAKVQAVAKRHRGLPRPEAAGRAIRVLRPTA
jgi:carnitine 3-dehydrogenase